MQTIQTQLRLLLSLLLMVFFGVETALAEIKCPEIKSAQDILECLKTREPNYQAALELRTAELDSRSAATRWVNPSLQAQGLFGKTSANRTTQVQVALLQPIQTGGKREAQKMGAEGDALFYQADSRSKQGDLIRKTVINLYRFKQIELELAAIREASETFSKLIAQYQSRPRLLPEQEVSLSIFKLSQSDYELRLLETINEEGDLKNYFKSLLGIDVERYKDILPVFIKPNAEETNSFKVGEIAAISPDVLFAKSASLKAIAEASQARGDAFSDISVGPMVGFGRDGGLQESLIGVMLNIPFPVWNQNGHKVAAVVKETNLKEENYRLMSRQIENEATRMIAYIDAAKTTLSKLPNHESISQKHQTVEKQFFRGLVSPALMIEAHRALVDFLVQRHQVENKITDTLWALYVMADRINEKSLESKK